MRWGERRWHCVITRNASQDGCIGGVVALAAGAHHVQAANKKKPLNGLSHQRPGKSRATGYG
jgi:hypothetical protein